MTGRRENIFSMFNNFAGTSKDIVQKAITTAATSAGAFDKEQLEKVITNTVYRLSALVAKWDVKYKPGLTSKFPRRTALPGPGSAIGQGGATAVKSSAFEKGSVEKKIHRRKGQITGFADEGLNTEEIDVMAQEIQSHIEAITYDIETDGMYGNAAANQYEFSGYDTFIKTNNDDTSHVVELKDLDDMLDANQRKRGIVENLAFVASPEMISKISRLMTATLMMSPSEIPRTEIRGGWRLIQYKNALLLPHGGMRPNPADANNVIGVVGSATATSGGSIADSTTYKFYVAPVTWDGEQLPCAEVSQATGASGSNINTITLSWTDVPGALKYYLFIGTTTGAANCTLKRILAADLYDGDGKVTGRRTSIVLTSVAVGAEVPTHLQSRVPLQLVGGIPEERLTLIDFDRFQGMGGFDYANQSGSALNGLITVTPLAQTDDWQEFLLKNYGALLDANEKSCFMKRRIRVA